MKFKLDENLGKRFKKLFISNGFDADTIYDEQLQGSTDHIIYDRIINEKRCLITLDLDFSDVTRFPPQNTEGIVVIKTSQKIFL